MFKKIATQNFSYISPTKLEEEYAFYDCKKKFCNKTCNGYNKEFVKAPFNSNSKKCIKSLKKRGALSGCVRSMF
jgi:hypothetical protein